MAADLQAARALLWTAARAIDEQGDDYWREYGSMGMVFATDRAFDVARWSHEMSGAQGIMFENPRPMQKYLRDCLSFLRSDGAQGTHKEVVINALREPYERQGS